MAERVQELLDTHGEGENEYYHLALRSNDSEPWDDAGPWDPEFTDPRCAVGTRTYAVQWRYDILPHHNNELYAKLNLVSDIDVVPAFAGSHVTLPEAAYTFHDLVGNTELTTQLERLSDNWQSEPFSVRVFLGARMDETKKMIETVLTGDVLVVRGHDDIKMETAVTKLWTLHAAGLKFMTPLIEKVPLARFAVLYCTLEVHPTKPTKPQLSQYPVTLHPMEPVAWLPSSKVLHLQQCTSDEVKECEKDKQLAILAEYHAAVTTLFTQDQQNQLFEAAYARSLDEMFDDFEETQHYLFSEGYNVKQLKVSVQVLAPEMLNILLKK